jgi:phage virion morphogenesis protein
MAKQRSMNFGKVLNKFAGAKRNIPILVSNEGLNWFNDSFRKQGFTDTSLEKWKARKKKDEGRAILVKSGTLRGANRVKSRSLERIVFANAEKYAAVHNYGLRSGRGKGFQMPKRQFMGKSLRLEANIAKTIDKQIIKIFK